ALSRAGRELKDAPQMSLSRTKIDGMPGSVTWTRAQSWLRRDWGLRGEQEGVADAPTFKALQTFLATHWGLDPALITGEPSEGMYAALQTFLSKEWGYEDGITGIPDVPTWMAFQRFVNSL